jgi:hypothetical protein
LLQGNGILKKKKLTILLATLNTMISVTIVAVIHSGNMQIGHVTLAIIRTKDQRFVVLRVVKTKWANGVANVITLTRTKMTFVLIVQEIRKVLGRVKSAIPSTVLIENPIHLNAINVETTCLVDGIVSPKKENLINVQNGTTPATTRGAMIVAWIA